MWTVAQLKDGSMVDCMTWLWREDRSVVVVEKKERRGTLSTFYNSQAMVLFALPRRSLIEG